MSHDTIVHRVVRPAVRVLARTGVAPDHLTALRLGTALVAAAAFARGGAGWIQVGAGSFLVSALLDRMDGELARQTRRFSQRGHCYDLLADCAAGVLAFLGLGLGAVGGPLGPAAAVLGLSAAAAVGILFWEINALGLGMLSSGGARGGRVLADPDDAMFAVPVLLLCFGAKAVLLAAGTVAPALALWTFVRARRATKAAPRRADARRGRIERSWGRLR